MLCQGLPTSQVFQSLDIHITQVLFINLLLHLLVLVLGPDEVAEGQQSTDVYCALESYASQGSTDHSPEYRVPLQAKTQSKSHSGDSVPHGVPLEGIPVDLQRNQVALLQQSLATQLVAFVFLIL